MEKASNCNIENLSMYDIARQTSQESYMQRANFSHFSKYLDVNSENDARRFKTLRCDLQLDGSCLPLRCNNIDFNVALSIIFKHLVLN